ncbi:MAG: hypothetical protein ACM3YE_13280, partial [Bacteroidota bacterium]
NQRAQGSSPWWSTINKSNGLRDFARPFFYVQNRSIRHFYNSHLPTTALQWFIFFFENPLNLSTVKSRNLLYRMPAIKYLPVFRHRRKIIKMGVPA